MTAKNGQTSAWELAKGQRGQILGFAEGLDARVASRLKDIGFHPGEWVLCVQTPAFGSPHLFRLSNTVYALDRDLANAVMVSRDGGSGA